MYKLNYDMKMRLEFNKLVYYKNIGFLSVFITIPKGTIVNNIDDKGEYYYQNPYHSNYYKAKVIKFGDIIGDFNEREKHLINNASKLCFLTINIDDFNYS